MKQATLTSFSPEGQQTCFGCDTCVCNLGIIAVSGVEKVHCRGQGLKPVNRIGCSGWWDGSNRADHWPKLPDNYRPPKERRLPEGMPLALARRPDNTPEVC